LYLLEHLDDKHTVNPVGILEVSFDTVPDEQLQVEIGRAIRKTGAYIVSKLKY
jgi:hypothetical protein